MKKKISNEEYLSAVNNKDNSNIIKSVLKRYSDILDYDTLTECSLHGLWRALQFHNGEKYTTKFTSSLWKFIKWECQQKMLDNKKSKKKYDKSRNVYDDDNLMYFDRISIDKENQEDIFYEINKHINEENIKILKMRFIDKLSLKDIGIKLKYSTQTIKNRIEKSISILREKMVYIQ